MYPVLVRFWDGRRLILWGKTAETAMQLSTEVVHITNVRYALDCGLSDSMVFCEANSWQDIRTITHRGDTA